MQLRVEFDPATVFAICDALEPPGVNDTAAHALNDTILNASDDAQRYLGPLMPGLPTKTIDDAIGMERAQPSHLEAVLVVAGRPLKLIEFDPQAGPGGVSVQIGGKTEVYRRAFIATGRSGRTVLARKGQARLPVRELYGPSIPGMFVRTDVVPRVLDALTSRLLDNLQRQLERRAREAGR